MNLVVIIYLISVIMAYLVWLCFRFDDFYSMQIAWSDSLIIYLLLSFSNVYILVVRLCQVYQCIFHICNHAEKMIKSQKSLLILYYGIQSLFACAQYLPYVGV